MYMKKISPFIPPSSSLSHTQLGQKLSLQFHIIPESNLVTTSTSAVLHVEPTSPSSGPIEERPTTAPQTAAMVSVSLLSSPPLTLSLRPATCPSMGLRQQSWETHQWHVMWRKGWMAGFVPFHSPVLEYWLCMVKSWPVSVKWAVLFIEVSSF